MSKPDLSSVTLRQLLDNQTETQRLDPLAVLLIHEVLGLRKLIETITTKRPENETKTPQV